jgi:cyclase
VFLGGKEVRARYLGRGHTNGDAVIYFPSERVLHTGDLCMTTGGPPFIDYSAGGSLVDWDKTLEQALQYDFDTVIPGHGPVSKKADLVKWRQTIINLRNKSKAACAAGGTENLKKMNLAEIGLTPSPMFDRSVPGICQELAR